MVPAREPIASDVVDAAERRAPAGSSAAASAVALPAPSRRPLSARASDQGFLPIETRKYAMLLDWTGRELRRDKRGVIPEDLARILDRLGVERSNWVDTVRDFGRMFKQAAG
jgi:putative transposase